MSDYLGFDRPVENTFDADQVAGTDVAVEASLMLVHPMLQICQFIAEIMQQYAQPHPWILVCSTYASSAMPQKRNPGPIIDIRRDAAAVLANLSSVIFRAHNLPTGMYDAKDEKLNCETVSDAAEVVERFDGLLRFLKVNRERALEELNRDWTASQELADVLMRRFGIPFRVGHSLASRMVSVARENNLTPKTFPHDGMVKLYDALRAEFADELPDLPEAFPLDEAAFRAVLDPAHIVAERAVEGGPQPESLDRLFASARARLTAETERLDALKRQLDDAEARLHADFASLI